MNTKRGKIRQTILKKHLIDSSYLPLDVLNKIREDQDLLTFSHRLPHWLQRRVLEIKQVFHVGAAGYLGNKEQNSGIYTSIVLDENHKFVFCLHKHHYSFSDIQQAIRAYKYLEVIVPMLKGNPFLAIENEMDWSVGLPKEFYDLCPQWSDETKDDIVASINSRINTETQAYKARVFKGIITTPMDGLVELICNNHYVPGAWNFYIFPQKTTDEDLSNIRKARIRIDNLMKILNKHSIFSDVAIGVLPFN